LNCIGLAHWLPEFVGGRLRATAYGLACYHEHTETCNRSTRVREHGAAPGCSVADGSHVGHSPAALDRCRRQDAGREIRLHGRSSVRRHRCHFDARRRGSHLVAYKFSKGARRTAKGWWPLRRSSCKNCGCLRIRTWIRWTLQGRLWPRASFQRWIHCPSRSSLCQYSWWS